MHAMHACMQHALTLLACLFVFLVSTCGLSAANRTVSHTTSAASDNFTIVCGPGFFLSQRTNTLCRRCPSGKFQYFSGLTFCSTCRGLSHETNTQRTRCLPRCPAGKHRYNLSAAAQGLTISAASVVECIENGAELGRRGRQSRGA